MIQVLSVNSVGDDAGLLVEVHVMRTPHPRLSRGASPQAADVPADIRAGLREWLDSAEEPL